MSRFSKAYSASQAITTAALAGSIVLALVAIADAQPTCQPHPYGLPISYPPGCVEAPAPEPEPEPQCPNGMP
ncbi:MAG: hypothetical protein GEV06_09435 [Luteitalea sp.]|nr:hypothetical protein [Luteitalea sp.]